VWDIIQEAKAGRAIVLTTHSMEEADVLGDRIAIMARGRLKAIGSSLRLKQKFGAGYTVAVGVLQPGSSDNSPEALASRAEGVREFFLARLGLLPFDEGRCHLHYLVPREQEGQLGDVLVELEAQQAKLGVSDVQLSLTSLEEVFLTIARKVGAARGGRPQDWPWAPQLWGGLLLAPAFKPHPTPFPPPRSPRNPQAELAAAEALGNTQVDVPLPDGGSLRVALGQDQGVNPADGRVYAIKWVQDDQGRLVVLDVLPLGSQLPSGLGLPGMDDGPDGSPAGRPPRAGRVVASRDMKRARSLTSLLTVGMDMLKGAKSSGSLSSMDASASGSPVSAARQRSSSGGGMERGERGFAAKPPQ
jgi:hypothetical protein